MKKFNIHFFILLFLISSVCIADTAIYIIGLKYVYAIAFGIIVNLLIFGILKYKKKIIFSKDFNKFDLIFLTLLFLYFITTIAMPDNSWDTLSYHIYLQENPFIDKINYDFFAGRAVNSFLYPLADRVNFLFRNILGYRLGTIGSYYILIVIFYQIKKFLKEMTRNVSEKLISIFSIFPLTMSIIIGWCGTYYIDNYSLCFLLEIFYIAFFEKDILKEKIKLYIFSLIIGISITLKISNIALLIPLAIYFVLKNIKELKNLKFRDYIISVLLLVFPLLIYSIYNLIQTGNPIFPYYNGVFKSEYFTCDNWKDTNFGYTNIIELLLWPVVATLNGKRAYDSRLIDIMWGIGFVIILLIETVKTKRKQFDKVFEMILVLVLTYILWSKVLLGYVRYATILLTLSNIIILVIILERISNKNIKIILKTDKLTIILLAILLISSVYSISLNALIKYDNIYNFLCKFTNFEPRNEYSYIENMKKIFTDRCSEKITIDGAWGAIRDDSLMPTLLRKNEPIYNLEDWVATTNKAREIQLSKIKSNKIYVPISYELLESKIEYLNANGYKIVDEDIQILNNIDFLNSGEELYIVRVEYVGDECENSMENILNSKKVWYNNYQ